MTPTSALARQHQLAQIDNGALAAAMTMEIFELFRLGKLSREQVVHSLVSADLLTHQAATRLASQFVQALRSGEGVEGVIARSPFNEGASYGRAVGTLRDLDRLRADPTRDWDEDFWKIVGVLAVRSDRFAKWGGRETVMMSSEASGRVWRRVSDGDPCAFCAMLVARGGDYTSERAALTVVGRGMEVSATIRPDGRRKRGGQAKGIKPRGSRGLGEKFHDNCGCAVVEVIGGWTPTAEEQRFIDLYEDNAGGTPSEVLARMRANGAGILSDAHVPGE